MLFLSSTFRIQEAPSLLPASVCTETLREDYVGRGIILGSRHIHPYIWSKQKLFVPVPSDYPEEALTSGLHPSLIIGETSNGFPRIEYGEDDGYIYLILSSKLHSSENGVGTIRVPACQGYCRIASIKVANQHHPQRHWKAVIARACPGNTSLVSWTPANRIETTSIIYHVVSPKEVISCRRQDLHQAFRKRGINPATLPFETWWSCCESKIKRSEWRSF